VVDKEVEFEYCPTEHQLADVFTKPLDETKFFCFLARFMLLGSFFTWVYFLLEPFLFFFETKFLGFRKSLLSSQNYTPFFCCFILLYSCRGVFRDGTSAVNNDRQQEQEQEQEYY
jgi:hypothetical protein